MRPRSGATRPGMACNVRVLPAPDGPKRTTNSSPAVKAAFRQKPGSPFSTSTLSMPESVGPGRPAKDGQYRHAGQCQNQGENVGEARIARLDGVIHGDGHGTGPSGDVTGHHEGGAELAPGPRDVQGERG